MLAHHVNVTLKDNGRSILLALGGGFANQDIANGVHLCLQSVAFSELTEESDHLLRSLRGARHLIYLRKGIKHCFRFKFHAHC